MMNRLDYVKEYVTLRRKKAGTEDTSLPKSLREEAAFRTAPPGKHKQPLPGKPRQLDIDDDLVNMGWAQVLRILRGL